MEALTKSYELYELATEEDLRECDAPWPKSAEELSELVRILATRQHDYGTCVYAMSLAAVAAYNYMAHAIGTTGFQASCADLDIIKRTRGMKHGFRIIDFTNLLYPQYERSVPGWNELLVKEADMLKREASKLLEQRSEHTHPDVVAHWKRLAKVSP